MKKPQNKKHRGTVMMAVGVVLVMAAAGLTAYNIWDENRAEKAMENVLDEFDSLMDTGQIENEIEIEPAFEEDPLSGEVEPEPPMPALTLDSSKYIGILEIPVLGLRLPIMRDWSYPNLKIAPCRYTGSAYMNNMVIAGHNYRSHFGSLNRVRPGDEVLFHSVDGSTILYNVAETETLMPTQIEHMIDSEWDLTLFTCTLGGRTRFTVRCTAQQAQIYDYPPLP